MAGIRDDSAGNYGTWDSSDLSWLDFIKATGSDVGNGAYNALSNITGALSPIGTSPEGNMSLQVPKSLNALANASDPYQDDALSYRASILPAGTKTRGSHPGGASSEELTLAWPEMITAPIKSYRRLMDPANPGSYHHLTGNPELDAAIQNDTLTVLTSLYGGNAVAGLAKPRNALGAGAMREAPNALDMSPEARMARARDLGFDPSARLFHGTENGPFEAFELGHAGASGAVGRKGLSNSFVTFATDPKHAQEYGDVGEYFVRGKVKDYDVVPDAEFMAQEAGYPSAQAYVDDFGLYDGIGIDDLLASQAKLAKSEGYDGLRLKFGDLTWRGFADNSTIGGDIFAAFDPTNIRSVNAAFDPARVGEAGLLLSDTGRPSIFGSALATAGEQQTLPDWLKF